MKVKVAILLITVLETVSGQSNFGYQPVPRGGHYISNGRYQNQYPYQQQQHNNYNNYRAPPIGNYNQRQQQYQPTSNNVIGNTAENIYGGGAVNSIIGSRFSDSAVNSVINPSAGSSNNVIGNNAYNVQGGSTNSILSNPYQNIPGLSSVFDTPFGAQLANNALQNAFGNLGNNYGRPQDRYRNSGQQYYFKKR